RAGLRGDAVSRRGAGGRRPHAAPSSEHQVRDGPRTVAGPAPISGLRLLLLLLLDLDLLDRDVLDRAAGGARGAADGRQVRDRLDGVEALDDPPEHRYAGIEIGQRRGRDHEDAPRLVRAGLRVPHLSHDAREDLEPVRLGRDVIAGGAALVARRRPAEDHLALDYAVEQETVVELEVREIDEIPGVKRREILVELEDDLSEVGFDDSLIVLVGVVL